MFIMFGPTVTITPSARSSSPGTRFQVSYEVENQGKRIETSKKSVTWVFSDESMVSTTVTLHWSQHSRKQSVELNEEEVWSGRPETTTSTFAYKWITEAGVKLHILASRVRPNAAKKEEISFLKYELMIDGQPFSKLPKQDGSSAEQPQESIVDILYPDGYDFYDPRFMVFDGDGDEKKEEREFFSGGQNEEEFPDDEKESNSDGVTHMLEEQSTAVVAVDVKSDTMEVL